MIELFENKIHKNDWGSSKGDQLKWYSGEYWYKADSLGYEGLAEYVISHILKSSTLKEDEYVPCDCLIMNGECFVNESDLTGRLNVYKKIALKNNSEYFNYKYYYFVFSFLKST